MVPALALFVLLEVVGLLAAPLTALVLGRLPGAGLGLSKVFGLLLVTWLVWIAASLNIAPYGVGLIVGVLVLVGVAGVLVGLRLRALGERASGSRRERLKRLALPEDPVRRRLFWGAELVFAVVYALGALFAAYSPDVWGTEKPMDMAFINAINASDSFPPHDPWMAGQDLNYYYLGHLAMALPIRILGIAPDHGYNLALALVFGLTAAAVFTLAGPLWAAVRAPRPELRGGPVAVGVGAVLVCLVLGTLAGVRSWLDATNPPADYDWVAVSRVVPDAIDEFPWFSWLLGDLHAHLLALPFVVLALAFPLQVVLVGPRGDAAWRGAAEALAAGLAIGALYAINSWSYPVAAGLLVLAVAVWLRDPRSAGSRTYALTWIALVLLASVVLVLPFWLNFDPAARGLGLVDDHRPFGRFLGDQALIFGIFVWILVAAFAGRLLAAAHPVRIAAWGGVAAIVA